jgi:hypothetical protein
MIRALKTPRDPPPPLGRYRRRGGGRWSRDTAECDRALRTRRQRGPPLPSSPRAAWREGVGRPPPGDRAGAHWRRAGASGHRCLLPVRRFAPRSLDRRKAEAVARPPPAPLGAAYRTRELSRRRRSADRRRADGPVRGAERSGLATSEACVARRQLPGTRREIPPVRGPMLSLDLILRREDRDAPRGRLGPLRAVQFFALLTAPEMRAPALW